MGAYLCVNPPAYTCTQRSHYSCPAQLRWPWSVNVRWSYVSASSSNRKHPAPKTTHRVERVGVVCCWKRWLIAKQEKWIHLPTYCEAATLNRRRLVLFWRAVPITITHTWGDTVLNTFKSLEMTWGSWYFIVFWWKTQDTENNITWCFPHLWHLAQRATRVMLRTRKTTREMMPTSGEEIQPIMPTMPTGAIVALLCEERQNRRQTCQRCGRTQPKWVVVKKRLLNHFLC